MPKAPSKQLIFKTWVKTTKTNKLAQTIVPSGLESWLIQFWLTLFPAAKLHQDN